MKIILLICGVCLSSYVTAEPSCPPPSGTDSPVYFAHPSDCSKFLTCHQGNLLEFSCPTGTLWNDNVKACDLPGNVFCSLQTTTTTEPTTTTTERTTTTTSVFQTTTTTVAAPTSTSSAPTGKCPDKPDPDHDVFLPHEDCTKYYICTWGGVPVEQSCPPHLHWNQQQSYCDYPSVAGCTV